MTKSARNIWRGDIWAVISALATGSGLIATKVILGSLNPISMNSQVFFIGGVILFIDSVLTGKIQQTVQIRFRQLLFLIIISFIFCGATLLLFSALRLVEPATVSFLSRLELAVTLILASVFLKERISLAESAGLILVLAGIVVMRYDASVELSRAVLLVIASSLLFGAGEVLIKSRINWIEFRALMFYRNIFMGIIFAIVGHIYGNYILATDARLVMLLLVAGFFLPYLGRMGYLKAMKNINVSRASIIVQSQPFFTAAAALLILGTFPSLKEMVGGILIVAGIITIALLEMRRRRINGTNRQEID